MDYLPQDSASQATPPSGAEGFAYPPCLILREDVRESDVRVVILRGGSMACTGIYNSK